MSLRTAERALNYFLVQKGNEKVIRFFGGEPLIEFDLIKKVVNLSKNKAKELGKKLKFDITTNGILLNSNILDFIEENESIELILSIDDEKKSQIERKNNISLGINDYILDKSLKRRILQLCNLTVNMTIPPLYVSNLYENFTKLYTYGFRRFNFLPAYYVEWSSEELSLLRNGFQKIRTYIQDKDIYIKNIFINKNVPLFSNALVIDYNGDIFPNNLIFSKHFLKAKPYLSFGNVNRKIKEQILLNDINFQGIIERYVNESILNSTQDVDDILSQFVADIKINFSDNKLQ